MKMTPCKSSQVAEYGYDPDTKTLAVRYKSGGLYHYSDVTPEVHDELCKAESVGKFLGASIKGKFTYKLIKEEKPDGKR